MSRLRFSADAIEARRHKISESYFAILMLSTATDYRGICETLSLPIGTVKSRLHRARLKLAKIVAEEGTNA